MQWSVTLPAFFIKNKSFIEKFEENEAEIQRDWHFMWGCSAIPSFYHALACIGLSHSMPYAHEERSHMHNIAISVSILVNNPLCPSSFATEKILKDSHQPEWDKPIQAKA